MYRFLLLFIAVFSALAQDQTSTKQAPEEPKEVLNIAINRIGFAGQVNFNYDEWFEMRDSKSHPKWSFIGPDIYVLGFKDIGTYREFGFGVGFEYRGSKRLTIDYETYVEQATGPDGYSKTWILPWARVEYHFPKGFRAESAFFPYVPVNGGDAQFVIERAKVEQTGFKHFNFGIGYGAYQDFAVTKWQSKPFATVTLKTQHLGNFECWFQRLPSQSGGFQIQIRHTITWHSRH